MRLLTTLILSMTFAAASAVDFTSISRNTPVTLVYGATFMSYVDVSLDLKAEPGITMHLRLRYVVGTDTLHDNLTVNGTHKGVVKQVLMKEGERLTAQVLLNNAEISEIGGLEGSFRAAVNPSLKVTTDLGKPVFISNVWEREQHPLFRVNFSESAPRDIQLTFHFNSNYEYDRLHFKVKVISPEQGILFLPRSVNVAEGSTLNLHPKKVTVTLEGVNFSYPGSYYFQVMHSMVPDRVNGVEKVSYEVIPQ